MCHWKGSHLDASISCLQGYLIGYKIEKRRFIDLFMSSMGGLKRLEEVRWLEEQKKREALQRQRYRQNEELRRRQEIQRLKEKKRQETIANVVLFVKIFAVIGTGILIFMLGRVLIQSY